MAKKKSLIFRLYLSYLVIILISLFLVAGYASYLLKKIESQESYSRLSGEARLAEIWLTGKLPSKKTLEVDAFCKAWKAKEKSRITIVWPDGRVLGDSQEDPLRMDNHADRPEVAQALAGKEGIHTRYSSTLKTKMLYVAIPIRQEGRIQGVIRTSIPLSLMANSLKTVYVHLAVIGFLIALLAAFISFRITRLIGQPLDEMRTGAERFARGELSYRLRIPDSEELTPLAEGINRMAAELDERIRTITKERNELEAVLAGMAEAVLTVDHEENIIRMNSAAGRLLGVKPENAVGKSVPEVIRNPELQRVVARIRIAAEPWEDTIKLFLGTELYLSVHGAPLRDEWGDNIGGLIVLYDITRLKRLEVLRRDFVANVSHELKTPITSIQGFIETLKEGALHDPEAAMKFLDILSRQTDRLNIIVEDLLSLSRLEEEEESGKLVLEKTSLKSILEAAITDCFPKAEEKGIKILLSIKDAPEARINPILIEQAVINLLDNAVKYSPAGSVVRLEAYRDAGEAVVKVEDTGGGIPKEHQERIFERFYRVDKARSRQLGGTGLGLAIVKHIMSVHRGRVYVESTVGQGSKFFLRLPAAD